MSRFHLLPPPLPLRLFLRQGTESPPASAGPATYSHSPEGKERRQHVGGRGSGEERKRKETSGRPEKVKDDKRKRQRQEKNDRQTDRRTEKYLGKK